MKYKFFVFLVALFFLFAIPLESYALSLEEEKKYGREVYLEIARSAPINTDPYISFYVTRIRDRLESVTPIPFPIVLTVIESQAVDAFATIGGYVFITTGLIGLCDKEEELAGVLAHEFAHIGKRHVAKSLEKQKFINYGMLATLLLGMLVGGTQSKAAVMTTGMASAQTLSLKYTREDEEEADRVGGSTADKAGYSAVGVAEFLKKLRNTGLDKQLPQYLLTHPNHEERIIKIENAWGGSRTTVDTSFFAYVLARTKILHRPAGTGAEEIWINRFEKDRNNPVNEYAASLVYALRGNVEESVKLMGQMNGPHKDLFLGEMLLDARKFKEAVETLKNDPEPLSRYFLAKAYEGSGDLDMAAETFQGVSKYGVVYPDIYYRLGMLMGRMGKEGEGYEYLGRYYLQTGKQSLAHANFSKAITKYGMNSPRSRELLNFLDELEPKKK
jgi:beta-barrel assembly-enhancing protease